MLLEGAAWLQEVVTGAWPGRVSLLPPLRTVLYSPRPHHELFLLLRASLPGLPALEPPDQGLKRLRTASQNKPLLLRDAKTPGKHNLYQSVKVKLTRDKHVAIPRHKVMRNLSPKSLSTTESIRKASDTLKLSIIYTAICQLAAKKGRPGIECSFT